MSLSVLTKWATSVALVAATLPAAAATASPSGQEPKAPDAPGAAIAPAESHRHVPELPEAASPTARQLLDEARSLFAETSPAKGRSNGAPTAPGPGSREASMTLLQLQLQRGDLSPAEQDEVTALTARPTGRNTYYQYPSGSKVKNTCTDKICVHWPTVGNDAPPLADSNRDGIPNQVDATMATMQTVWQRVVTQGGYKAPRRDKGTKARPKQGPNRKFDVYLADVGRSRLFGYCTIDPLKPRTVKRKGWDAPGFCVLDNDFDPAQYGSTKPANQLLQVTAAHEFFHAVQFAYDIGEDPWFMEGTAAWVEDEIFDHVNDNLTFLARSQAKNPNKPLDFGKGMSVYGSWLWWRFLTERMPDDKGTGLPVIIKEIWNRADDSASDPRKRGTYSIKATKKVLASRKKQLTKLYAEFGVANRHPASAYREGASYPTVPLKASYALTAAQPQIAEHKATMPHLTNFSVAFKAGSGIADGWKLALQVDGPPKKRGSYAQATVVRNDGSRTSVPIKLNKKGRGDRKVDFDGSTVKQVELTMTNAGIRYRCPAKSKRLQADFTGTVYSCAGKPRDDGAKFFFKAKAVKQ